MNLLKNKETWQWVLIIVSILGVIYGIVVNRYQHQRLKKQNEMQGKIDALLDAEIERTRQFLDAQTLSRFNQIGMIVN